MNTESYSFNFFESSIILDLEGDDTGADITKITIRILWLFGIFSFEPPGSAIAVSWCGIFLWISAILKL
jgi:hypothetical protein